MDLFIALGFVLVGGLIGGIVVIRRKLRVRGALAEFYATKPVDEQKLVLPIDSIRPTQTVLNGNAPLLSANMASKSGLVKKQSNLGQEIYSVVRFKYCDSDGVITERTVDVTMGKRGEMFRGYCYLRNEERTFFFDRIHGHQVMDMESGLSKSPKEWRYQLQGTKTAFEEWQQELRRVNNAKRRKRK